MFLDLDKTLIKSSSNGAPVEVVGSNPLYFVKVSAFPIDA